MVQLVYNPFEKGTLAFLQFFNNIICLVIQGIIFFLVFDDHFTWINPSYRITIGWVIIGLFAIDLAGMFTILLYEQGKLIIKAYKFLKKRIEELKKKKFIQHLDESSTNNSLAKVETGSFNKIDTIEVKEIKPIVKNIKLKTIYTLS